MRFCEKCGGLIINNIHVCPMAGAWLPGVVYETDEKGIDANSDYYAALDSIEGRCIDDGEL